MKNASISLSQYDPNGCMFSGLIIAVIIAVSACNPPKGAGSTYQTPVAPSQGIKPVETVPTASDTVWVIRDNMYLPCRDSSAAVELIKVKAEKEKLQIQINKLILSGAGMVLKSKYDSVRERQILSDYTLNKVFFYLSLANAKESNRQFLRGWLNRLKPKK